MPSELQLHPLKLKHKLEYKIHYMYHVIQKDNIIGTITWLKQCHTHYADIIPNDDWYSSITNSELATLVYEDVVHQEGCEVAVTNTRTQTHDPDLDNKENTYEQ